MPVGPKALETVIVDTIKGYIYAHCVSEFGGTAPGRSDGSLELGLALLFSVAHSAR